MPIQFTCPHCGAQTDVADELAGQTGPCAQCGQTITIPPMAVGPTDAPSMRRSANPVIVVIAILVAVLMVVLVCGGILAALLLPAIGAPREAARRAVCLNNLKQISVAMLNYEAENGCFPPAYTTDENGKPLHSWRVLILPYLEQEPLYDQFKLDEPWDSPHNLALADMMPQVYRCLSDSTAAPSDTSYLVITGPGTVFDGTESAALDTVAQGDGASRTLLVVEAAGSGIHWLQPQDLDAETMSFVVNDPTGEAIRSDHPAGACVVLCDESVRFLDDATSPEQVRAMSTIAGAEAVAD